MTIDQFCEGMGNCKSDMTLLILECPLCEKLYPSRSSEEICPHCIREKTNYQELCEIEVSHGR